MSGIHDSVNGGILLVWNSGTVVLDGSAVHGSGRSLAESGVACGALNVSVHRSNFLLILSFVTVFIAYIQPFVYPMMLTYFVTLQDDQRSQVRSIHRLDRTWYFIRRSECGRVQS